MTDEQDPGRWRIERVDDSPLPWQLKSPGGRMWRVTSERAAEELCASIIGLQAAFDRCAAAMSDGGAVGSALLESRADRANAELDRAHVGVVVAENRLAEARRRAAGR